MNLVQNDIYVIDALQLCKWDRDYLLELQKGNVKVVHACCSLWENARETLTKLNEWYRFIQDNSDLVYQIQTSEDLENIHHTSKVGIILGAQNSSMIESELGLVEVFNRLGLKVIQLTYNNQNFVGSSCYEETDIGISRFGKLVIEEMNKLGMVIDLSHCGEKTTLDAIKYSKRPVAITHANPDWIYYKERNKSRQVLEALRENGGVLGICAYPHLIGGSTTTLEEFCTLITRTVDFMGIEQVGLGTDLTINMPESFISWMRMGRWTHQVDYGAGSKSNPNWPDWPEWFKGPLDFQNIAEGLIKTGFHENEVRKIMGENWYRFFKEGFLPSKEVALCKSLLQS
jgi:membrane dipeptidase